MSLTVGCSGSLYAGYRRGRPLSNLNGLSRRNEWFYRIIHFESNNGGCTIPLFKHSRVVKAPIFSLISVELYHSALQVKKWSEARGTKRSLFDFDGTSRISRLLQGSCLNRRNVLEIMVRMERAATWCEEAWSQDLRSTQARLHGVGIPSVPHVVAVEQTYTRARPVTQHFCGR